METHFGNFSCPGVLCASHLVKFRKMYVFFLPQNEILNPEIRAKLQAAGFFQGLYLGHLVEREPYQGLFIGLKIREREDSFASFSSRSFIAHSSTPSSPRRPIICLPLKTSRPSRPKRFLCPKGSRPVKQITQLHIFKPGPYQVKAPF